MFAHCVVHKCTRHVKCTLCAVHQNANVFYPLGNVCVRRESVFRLGHMRSAPALLYTARYNSTTDLGFRQTKYPSIDHEPTPNAHPLNPAPNLSFTSLTYVYGQSMTRRKRDVSSKNGIGTLQALNLLKPRQDPFIVAVHYVKYALEEGSLSFVRYAG